MQFHLLSARQRLLRMLPMKWCPSCGQPMPILRLGVKLTPLKARLYDAVQFRGGDGILTDTVCTIFGMNSRTLKAHIHQINQIIAKKGYRIYGRGGYLRLIRTKRKTIIDKLEQP
jgi:hypothetical protein